MRILLLLLFILVPATVLAQTTYDLSCDNVARMRIVRVTAEGWQIDSPDGFFHVLAVELKPHMTEEFGELVKASRKISIHNNGKGSAQTKLTITANGKPLRNDEPRLLGLDDQGVLVAIINEQDAFDAARSVCPALVPTKILIDGQLE